VPCSVPKLQWVGISPSARNVRAQRPLECWLHRGHSSHRSYQFPSHPFGYLGALVAGRAWPCSVEIAPLCSFRIAGCGKQTLREHCSWACRRGRCCRVVLGSCINLQHYIRADLRENPRGPLNFNIRSQCRNSSTTLCASIAGSRLSDRQHTARKLVARISRIQSGITLALTAAEKWDSWAVTSPLRQRLTNRPGWPRNICGKLVFVFRAAAIIPMHHFRKSNKRWPPLWKRTPIMFNELAAPTTGENMPNSTVNRTPNCCSVWFLPLYSSAGYFQR
jgi:hypothetical protein